MAGVYIHIPFCKSRCTYCDFYTGTNESQIDAFVEVLCAEARMRAVEFSETIQTVYFGGGTPSRLHQKHFEQIFKTLYAVSSIHENAEITLEANPDDLSPDYIRMLPQLPFNRISIGIQSFNDDELKFLNRRHSAQQAIDAVKNCKKAGFNNISIDMMYGLPNQTLDIWKKDLQQAIDLNIQHISAYHLIYEEKTRMYSLLQAGKIHPVDEEMSTQMFSELIETLTNAGFTHYEISNFGKTGCFSQHNSSYWKGEKYIGLGPAAHSFDGNNRSWNISSLSRYIKNMASKAPERETEHLTLNQKYNEFILTGLRTIWGIDLQQLKIIFGERYSDFCMQNAQKYMDEHLLKTENGALKLTRDGIFISDGIMSELMWVD